MADDVGRRCHVMGVGVGPAVRRTVGGCEAGVRREIQLCSCAALSTCLSGPHRIVAQ